MSQSQENEKELSRKVERKLGENGMVSDAKSAKCFKEREVSSREFSK